MSLQEFTSSLQGHHPPKVNVLLQALWYEAKGDWEKAHSLVQDDPTQEGAWIHAYLHRVEGDTGNAQYWYQRANRKMPKVALKEEWNSMVMELLDQINM